MSSAALPTRRFGRTEIAMPVLSLGGMRFQQSWTDLAPDAITGNHNVSWQAPWPVRCRLDSTMLKPRGITAVRSGNWVGLFPKPRCPDPSDQGAAPG